MAIKEVIVTTLTLKSSKFTKGVGDSKKAILGLSASLVGASLAIGKMTTATAIYNDEMIKTARRVGTTAEQYSKLAYVAELSGLSQEHIVMAMKKLSAVTPTMAKNLEKYGLSLDGIKNGSMTSIEAMEMMADKMNSLDNSAQKTAFAVDIFGEEVGARMVNFLANGSSGIEQLTNEAERFGIVVSEEAGKASELFNDNLSRVQKAVKGLTKTIGESSVALTNESGIMTDISDAIVSVTQFWKDLDDTTKDNIITAVEIAGALGGVVVALTAVTMALKTVSTASLVVTGVIVGLTAAFYAAAKARDYFNGVTEDSIRADKIWKKLQEDKEKHINRQVTLLKKLYKEEVKSAKIQKDGSKYYPNVEINEKYLAVREQLGAVLGLNQEQLEELASTNKTLNKVTLEGNLTNKKQIEESISQNENNIKQKEVEISQLYTAIAAKQEKLDLSYQQGNKTEEEIEAQAILRKEIEKDLLLYDLEKGNISALTGEVIKLKKSIGIPVKQTKTNAPKTPKISGAKRVVQEETDYLVNSYDKAYKQVTASFEQYSKYLKTHIKLNSKHQLTATKKYAELYATSFRKLDDEVKKYQYDIHTSYLAYVGEEHEVKMRNLKTEYNKELDNIKSSANVKIKYLEKVRTASKNFTIGALELELKTNAPLIYKNIEAGKVELDKKLKAGDLTVMEYTKQRKALINGAIDGEIKQEKDKLAIRTKGVKKTYEDKKAMEEVMSVIASINKYSGHIALSVDIAGGIADGLASQITYAGEVASATFDKQALDLEKGIAKTLKDVSFIYGSGLDELTELEKEAMGEQYDVYLSEHEKVMEMFEQQARDEIQAEMDKAQAKLDIQEGYWMDIRNGSDAFWQEQKAKLEDRFAQEREQLIADYEFKKELVDRKTVDKEEQQLVDTQMEADYLATLENMKKEQEQRLLEAQREYNSNIKSGQDALNGMTLTDEAIHDRAMELMNKAAKDKEKDAQNKHDAEMEALDKARAEKEWLVEQQVFEQTKATQISSALMAGFNGAVQAFAGAMALGPIAGPIVGGALAAAVMASTAINVRNIESQKPIKPAALMEKGGVLGGNYSHAGGINITAESREAIIDKERTQKIEDFVDNNTSASKSGQIFNINFYKDSIMIDRKLDDAMVDDISVKIADKMKGEVTI